MPFAQGTSLASTVNAATRLWPGILFIFFRTVGLIQQNPLSWLSGTLYEEMRETRRSMLVGGITMAAGAGLYYVRGAGAAIQGMQFVSQRLDDAASNWDQWQRDYRRPKTMAEQLWQNSCNKTSSRPLQEQALQRTERAFGQPGDQYYDAC